MGQLEKRHLSFMPSVICCYSQALSPADSTEQFVNKKIFTEFLKTSVSPTPKQIHLQSMQSVKTLLPLFPSSQAILLPFTLLLKMVSGHRGGKGASLVTGLSSKSPGDGGDFIQSNWSDLVLATLNCTASYIVANLTSALGYGSAVPF